MSVDVICILVCVSKTPIWGDWKMFLVSLNTGLERYKIL